MCLMCSVQFYTARPSIMCIFLFVFSCLCECVYVSNYCLWFYDSDLCFISTQNLHMNASSSFIHNRLHLEAVEMAFSGAVQSLSRVWLFVTARTAAHQASLSFAVSRSLLKLMSIELVMPSNHVILCCPLLLPSIFPNIRVSSNESAFRIRWPKYCSFGFNISPSSEYSGLVSLRIDSFDLLEVQGTLKTLLQDCILKGSVLQHSAFFMVKLSHPYMTPGKTIVLTRWTLVSKAMSQLFNTSSLFVTAFLQ